MAALAAVVTLGGTCEVAGARAVSVRVPRLHGGLVHAYALLHRAGLRVTIRHGFTLSSDRTVMIGGVAPAAGTRVRRGSTVRLTVSCCQRLRHPPKLGRTASEVPSLVGQSAGTTVRWASRRKLRFSAKLGPLHSAEQSQLLGNYRVTRQAPGRGRQLISRRVRGTPHGTRVGTLEIHAVQGQPAPCTPPLYATTVTRDPQAVISSAPDGTYYGGTEYYGCALKVGTERQLFDAYESSLAGGGQSAGFSLAGTEVGIESSSFSGKAMACEASLDTEDLTTGRSTHLFSADCEPGESQTATISSFLLNAEGFSAWHVDDAPSAGDAPHALVDVSCPTVSMCVAVDAAGTVFTSTDPTGGRSAWTAATIPNVAAASGVSCPTTTLCVIAAGTQVLTSTDPTGGAGTWTATTLPGSAEAQDVACPSPSLCVAVGSHSVSTSTNPTGGTAAWSGASVHGSSLLDTVDCPSASLCVATDALDGALLSSTDPAAGASTWKATHVDGTNALEDTGCPSSSMCVAVDASGNILTSTNPAGGAGAWTVSKRLPVGLTGVSCPTTSECVAVTENGFATSTAPTTGAWTLTSVPGSDRVAGISCPSTGLCVGVTDEGQITTSTNPTGGAGTWNEALVDGPDCGGTGGCYPEQIYAHDSMGTRIVDSVPSGPGDRLGQLALAGDQLTWTHDGAPRQATLS